MEKKIAFISCVNNEQLYDECVKYIENLIIPYGIKIELIPIRGAKSIMQGYNMGMKKTDAKYKVYLHQDTFIINKNFINDILEIFETDNNIGMLGVIGSKAIPTNAIWWESYNNYGKVYNNPTGNMELLAFQDIDDIYEKVQAIDGLIMITQHDIEWREDIFDGWDFYDLSQCVEFIKVGYNVVIPRQEEPWCLHDCGIINIGENYERLRNIFIDEYSKQIFPLVSILIPTYNQTIFLKEALESAINQTYPNIEIIIGDDSTNDEVFEFVKPYLHKYTNLRYFKNEKSKMDYGISNGQKLFQMSRGAYINYLFHDDIFHKDKISLMMNYFFYIENTSLVTSHRQLINEKGEYLSDNNATKALFEKTTSTNGKSLSLYCLKNMTNFIGEPTTVLFKKALLVKGFGYYNNNFYENIIDLATWFSLLEEGNAIYISDTLSYCRQHANQNSKNFNIYLKGLIEWKRIIEDSYVTGLIDSDLTYKSLLSKWFSIFSNCGNDLAFKDIDYNLRIKISECYADTINKLIFSNDEYNHKCIICNNNLDRFLPWSGYVSDYTKRFDVIGSDIDNFTCPHCNSHDRERHLYMFFSKMNIWETSIINRKVLHIAPEYHLQKRIGDLNTIEYICGDLYPTNNSIIKMDITALQFNDNYFDFIICNHVLEHIPNDIQAMKELYRVLKNGGYAVLQTPYSPKLSISFEDKEIDTDDKRLKYYGQEDHVRVYGLDFFERLKSVGFKLKIVESDSIFTEDVCKKYGVNNKENLILVSK
ncbi:glycosyltransferase [Clostridium sp. YIM B02506]|uniref:glycosyltransferase n=1 Tax=Clostridium sp. YIM B02506 TaxID=2910680 RepID=UPI001EED56DB|nr:glycosyltransferase [Clostridium sp. YIM B02506]